MKRFCDLKVGDKIYSKLDGKYFEEEVLENFEFDCDEYTWQLMTDLDTYQLIENDLEKDFVILENFDGIKQSISTSIDKLLLELEEC